MVTAREFPVRWEGPASRREALESLGCPRAVPWDFILPHETNCLRFHNETVQGLSDRGGLSPEEILVVIDPPPSMKERWAAWYMAPEESVPKLKAALAAYVVGKETRT